MAGLCSRSEQCEYDIMRKLRLKGLSSLQVRELMDFLIEGRYVDNRRFAKSFARDKARFVKWGPKKIRAELSLRKIPSAIIIEAIEEIEEEVWEEGLMKCAVSKARSLDLTGEDGYEERRKLFAYLIGRGFSGKDANRAVKIMKQQQSREEGKEED